ncbi:uncharacterized protein MONOS_17396 [Monocercomonoides exilis]|uniref:uncharacterized protein n=1 Tax=Monocercomonoides exilis TaxID=2049356 RepID=UPI00355A3B2C|nr:hypothetical protein MONOS_17396 [Monocercomonoides exilis]
MSEINIDDELAALPIFYPGYKKIEGDEKYKTVEVFNKVVDITYKITLHIEKYPKEPALVSISDYSNVTRPTVLKIEADANKFSQSHPGELIMIELLDEVQTAFREVDPGKEKACGPEQCPTCIAKDSCTQDILDSVTDEDIEAVPQPSFITSVSTQNNILSNEEALKPKQSLVTSGQLKPDTSFDPKKELF